MTRETGYMYDSGLVLKAAGLIAASAASATVIDLGSASAIAKGEMVIEVTALEIASNDEIYDIVLQGSTVAAFATDTAITELCAINLSAAEVKRTDCNKDDAIGRYVVPFTNEQAGTIYRYLRVYTVVAGTIATGINYSARLSVAKFP